MLVGGNVLGRLLMELRNEIRSGNNVTFEKISPPDVPNLLLMDARIESIHVSQSLDDAGRTPTLRFPPNLSA
jgi:hypothetical protein